MIKVIIQDKDKDGKEEVIEMPQEAWDRILKLVEEKGPKIREGKKTETNKFKPKTKEKWRKEAIIKIETLLEITENPKGCFENKEKVIAISIDKPDVTVSTCFEYNKKGKKDLLEWIKRELYL